jgi:nitrate reductase NapE
LISAAEEGPETEAAQKKRDLLMFLFLTVVLAPATAVAIVGAYGFAIWMVQLIAGPPGA